MKFTPEGAPVLDKRYRWFLKVRVLDPSTDLLPDDY